MKLVIVGNGFDLNLRLRTDYLSFKKNLDEIGFFDKHNVEDFYPFFEEEEHILNADSNVLDFELPIIDENGNSIKVASYSWSQLEKLISAPSYQTVKSIYGIDRFQVDYKNLIDDFESMLLELRDNFRRWIKNETEFLNKQNVFRDNLLFISFNYSKTLESMFGVDSKSICYIHNNCDDGEIIFGCMKEEIDFWYNVLLYTNDFDKKIKNILYKYIKNTNKIINDKLLPFLSNVSIDEICVLGHSLADVDKNYFKFLNQKYPNVKWYISYYIKDNNCNEDEVIHQMIDHIRSIGIKSCVLFQGISEFFEMNLYMK